MLKKMILGLLTAIFLVTSSVGIAFAGEGSPPPRQQTNDKRKAVPVLVVGIGSDQITVQGKNGEHRFLLTEATEFKNREGESLSISDLSIGGYVVVRPGKDDEGNVFARMIVILPDDFSPQEQSFALIKGTVSHVHLLQRSFDLVLDSGKTVTVVVNSETRFMGFVSQLSDLEASIKVGAAVLRNEDGTLLAKAVVSRKPSEDRPDARRATGRVTSVDGSTLTIETKDGSLNLSVNGETVIKGSQGKDIRLGDIQIGAGVTVAYTTQEGGALVALHISVKGSREERPQVRKAHGEVTSISDRQISIVKADGATLSFSITPDTHFVSRDGSINQASDIQSGQKVVVIYFESEDGKLIAKIIGGGKTPR